MQTATLTLAAASPALGRWQGESRNVAEIGADHATSATLTPLLKIRTRILRPAAMRSAQSSEYANLCLPPSPPAEQAGEGRLSGHLKF